MSTKKFELDIGKELSKLFIAAALVFCAWIFFDLALVAISISCAFGFMLLISRLFKLIFDKTGVTVWMFGWPLLSVGIYFSIDYISNWIWAIIISAFLYFSHWLVEYIAKKWEEAKQRE